jgi:cation diffusion facilitator CzcD-associated flavoprotein CzcO/acetyl esterase/lipase
MIETIHPRGTWDALVAGALRASLRLLLKPVFSPRFSIGFQRRWLETLARWTLLTGPGGFEAATVGGVPGEWARRGKAPALRRGSILFLHGGAYCIGSPATHRSMTARLARLTGLPVFAADYRLAPEHPFPAGLDDAVAAYRAMRADGPVFIGGDSAGGGLSLATALALRDAGDPPPAGLLLFSPWADLVTPDPLPVEPPGEAMLSVAWAQACADMYVGAKGAAEDNLAEHNPLVSPLRGDLRGLPPVLIQVGTDEMLNGQAKDLHAALEAAQVPVRCEVFTGRWHVFQLHAGGLPSADDALNRVARFVLQELATHDQPQESRHQVVILGAGMSGLCMAIGLQKAGIHDFLIVEKQPGLGGTWWDNTYPGAHVDVPAPLYSFSFAPNPNWTRRFASAPEIQSYMQGLAERRALLPRMRLGTRLTDAAFDESTGLWTLHTDRGDTLHAPFFVCSTGPLSQPRWPEIAGLESFARQKIHSARWDESIPLAGRRVAVIGTGSTASQLIPPIAKQAAQLTVFQRTANWILPRIDRPYNMLDRALARLPVYPRVVRASWQWALEWGRRGFDEGTFARKVMLRGVTRHRNKQVPDAALRAKLTPNYPLGCKRLIYSSNYYKAMGKPNVELVTGEIARITPTGVVGSDGVERPVDVLVCATGFDTVHLLSSIRVTGLNGQTLRDAWGNVPQAYYGISVSGFPNLFTMLGPNTATGHTSTLLFIEPGVQHAIACMKAVLNGKHRWIQVRPEVMQAHNASLQSRLKGSVWTQCHSWYQAEDGRVIALFPGFTAEYVKGVERPDLGAYEFG